MDLRLNQGIWGHLFDIAQVYKRDSPPTRRQVQAVIVPDIRAVCGSEILGEEAGAQNGPVAGTGLQVLFDFINRL
jgi:hypothetical protein